MNTRMLLVKTIIIALKKHGPEGKDMAKVMGRVEAEPDLYLAKSLRGLQNLVEAVTVHGDSMNVMRFQNYMTDILDGCLEEGHCTFAQQVTQEVEGALPSLYKKIRAQMTKSLKAPHTPFAARPKLFPEFCAQLASVVQLHNKDLADMVRQGEEGVGNAPLWSVWTDVERTRSTSDFLDGLSGSLCDALWDVVKECSNRMNYAPGEAPPKFGISYAQCHTIEQDYLRRFDETADQGYRRANLRVVRNLLRVADKLLRA